MSPTFAVAALVLLIAGVIGFARMGEDATRAAPAAPAIRVDDGTGDAAVVHVAGAVRRPGVYRLPPGSRVDDALRRAGGARRRADLSAVNLAAPVEDGRQVLVPERVRAAVGAGGAPAAAGTQDLPLNLNTATLEQLDELDGVGPATAQKILDHREERGGFGSVEELGEIPGIGEKRLASLREAVSV